ncbi:hypothetical protein HMPREF9140_01189 [Prevotella micans F0438]|jgi:rhodanese family protein|uniref:Rhodanese domain-containing protein n=1 Tax=Prevotella micans F0438 TaxID=883158 RepID=H1Q2Q1_9BACT|nr:rhodanese-like domain-containing protein [Prevotella micans]EHO70334.1 hypothetical protein HMPREF9140_01189 [Prevotella micans F0438]
MKKLFLAICAALGCSMGATAQNAFDNMNVKDFEALITSDSIQVLDVRTPAEFSDGHIKGAININVLDSSFMNVARQKLDKGRMIAIYCRSGKRSAMACSRLAGEGYRTTNLLGGIIAWTKEQRPVVK